MAATQATVVFRTTNGIRLAESREAIAAPAVALAWPAFNNPSAEHNPSAQLNSSRQTDCLPGLCWQWRR